MILYLLGLLLLHTIEGEAAIFSVREINLERVNGSEPNVNQLSDGIVPVLHDIEGENWARELFTHFNDPIAGREMDLIADVSNTFEELKIEVVMFNCPQWNIGASSIRYHGSNSRRSPDGRYLGEVNSLPTSCDNLVHICLPAISTAQAPIIRLSFGFASLEGRHLHIAEIIFNRESCPARYQIPNPISTGSTFGGDPVNGSKPSDNRALDGVIPTLTNLQSDTWARELLTLQARNPDVDTPTIFPDIRESRLLGFVEVVMFNCPEWNIGPDIITFSGESSDGFSYESSLSNFPTSCDGLIHACLPNESPVLEFQSWRVSFSFNNKSGRSNVRPRWVHVAEVITVLTDGGRPRCPSDLKLPAFQGNTEETFSQNIVIGTSVGAVFFSIAITTIICLPFMIIVSRRHAQKSRKNLPKVEGKARVLKDTGGQVNENQHSNIGQNSPSQELVSANPSPQSISVQGQTPHTLSQSSNAHGGRVEGEECLYEYIDREDVSGSQVNENFNVRLNDAYAI